MKRVALLTALAVVTVACLGSDFADSIEGSWLMTSGTVDGEQIPIIDGFPITIDFEGDQVGGTAACNGYGGTFELSGSAISFENIAMTEMACVEDGVMESEGMYGGALIRVDTVAVDNKLTLTGDGVELVFESAS